MLKTQRRTWGNWCSTRVAGRRRGRLESLEPRQLLAGDVVIAEVLATNDHAYKDEDGTSSDYIELFNSGHQSVDLEGWHLTDTVDNRARWTFPETVLGPGNSLVVFASGKNRAVSGQPLHTDFKVSASGEYVGLYEPDGRTVASAYDLPQQFTDVSYGIGQQATTLELVGRSSPARVWLPSSANQEIPVDTWTAADYDDTGWTTTSSAVGYDDDLADGDFTTLIDSTLSDMRGNTASAYLRTEFEIAESNGELPIFRNLGLDLNYDDGFIAYLNGQEVARANASLSPAWDSTATQANGGFMDTIVYQDLPETEFTLNGDASASDGVITVTPSAANQNGAAWRTEPVMFGPDYTFKAVMVLDVHSPGGGLFDADRDGIGGEGVTFVLQTNDNNVLGTGGKSLGLENTGSTFLAVELDSGVTGAFDPDTNLPSHLGINTNVDGSVARTAISRFNGNAFSAGVPGPGSNFQYLWVEYNGGSQILDVYYSTSEVKPDEPTLSTPINLSKHFGGVPGVFVGWTSSTSKAFNGHDVHSFEMLTGVGEIGRDVVSYDLSEHVDKLQVGTNLLAFHGLNEDANDKDYLLVPRLTVDQVDLTNELGFFPTPTPGRLNGDADDPPSGSVEFSVPSKLFTEEFAVEIVASAPDAQIRYTTDGSLPDESSSLYEGPITVSNTTRLRARAFEPNRSAGPSSTVGYTIVSDQLSNFEEAGAFESNLPIVVIDSFGDNAVNSGSTRLVLGVGHFIETGPDGRANLFDEPAYVGRVGARTRGQSSQSWAKRQYALELVQGDSDDSEPVRANGVQDFAVSLFGLPVESDWVMNGPYADKTQLNNYLTFMWSRKIGQYAPRTKMVEVFVNTSISGDEKLDFEEDYRGTYILLEKIKVDENRVDITGLQPGASDITGGYIWKKDKTGAEDLNIKTEATGQEVRIIEPSCADAGTNRDERMSTCKTGEISDAQIRWLRDHLTEFEDVLYGPKFTDPVEGYAKYIDVDSWVDTWLLVEFTKNIDGFRLSTYYHKDAGGKIKQGPAWDYNLSLGNANYLQGGNPRGWYGELLTDEAYPYWRRLFEDPLFEQRVIDRWFELRQTVFSTENMHADIQAAVDLISDGNPNLEQPADGKSSNPVARNFERWTKGSYGLDKYHWPNCFFKAARGDCPPSPLPDGREPIDYSDQIFLLKRFVELRADWIDEQFAPDVTSNPAPGLVGEAARIELQGPVGYEIYYTLDGTDPEQPLYFEDETVLIGENATAEFVVPRNNEMMEFCAGTRLPMPQNCFVNPDYELGLNGETWTSAIQGIGYDESGNYDSLISTDIGDALRGENSSIYVRVPFELTQEQIDNVDKLFLDVRFDDAFTAYFWRANGITAKQIAKGNVISRPSGSRINAIDFDTVANEDRLAQDAVNFERFVIRTIDGDLRVGTNYLVFQAINDDADSSDFLFDVRLTMTAIRTEESPNVLPYTGPIDVDENTQIVARGFKSATNQWTRALLGEYIADTPSLQITELNYNPIDPTEEELAAGLALESDDFEFIEIKNTSNETISLSGTRFTSGITYEFRNAELAGNAYAVLVKNQDAFELRYGTDAYVWGEYGGNLDNAGERIVLETGGLNLADFTYNDADPWTRSADGRGATLELLNDATPASQLSQPQNWRGSVDFLGTPGRERSEFPGVMINEILARTDQETDDAVELINISSSAVDVSGWYLSDSANNLHKYRIPDGSKLDPLGVLVLTEQQFNVADDPNGFRLNGTAGDDVWLTVAGDDGKTISIVDNVTFLGSLDGESLGRYPDGVGRLAPMSPSLGTLNRYPRVGPVVISELHYNAATPNVAALEVDPDLVASDLEFVELHNPTDQVIELTDWRIRGGIDLNFDLGAQLVANETVVVVRFDPKSTENAARTAAFRTHYELGEQVRLMGGYQGRQSGDGERVTLLSRDRTVLDEPEVLPILIEDEVVYDDSGRWPNEADGSGASLNRTAADQYGNLSTSWVVAVASPGAVNFVGAVSGDLNGDGIVNVIDVDRICQAVRAGDVDPVFDLDSNGLVDHADQMYLVQSVLRTSPGDANLDGFFDSRDIVAVFIAGEYSDGVDGNSGWSDGDWNCDGDFTSEDIVLAFQYGGYVAKAQPHTHDLATEIAAVAAAVRTPLVVQHESSAFTAEFEDQLEEADGRPVELLISDRQIAFRDQYFAEFQEDDGHESIVDDAWSQSKLAV